MYTVHTDKEFIIAASPKGNQQNKVTMIAIAM
jgi:hypothetical protein